MCVEAAALLNKNEKSKGYKIDFFKRQTHLPMHGEYGQSQQCQLALNKISSQVSNKHKNADDAKSPPSTYVRTYVLLSVHMLKGIKRHHRK